MTDPLPVLLNSPAPQMSLRLILLATLYLHLLFVLVLIGTVMVGTVDWLRSWRMRGPIGPRPDRRTLRKVLALKTLAIVLGVGPLLTMQVCFPGPLHGAAGSFGAYWLVVAGVMIVAFLLIDGVAHGARVHPTVSLILGMLGLVLTLAIPAAFVAVLVAAENFQQPSWPVGSSFNLSYVMSLHWLLRYLHILAAAAVFGAAFLYLATSGRSSDGQRRRRLAGWVIGGMIVQVLIGTSLMLTILKRLTPWMLVPLLGALAAAALLVWLLAARGRQGRHRLVVAYLLPLTLLGMLLTRQYIQDQKLLPVAAQQRAYAEQYAQTLARYAPAEARQADTAIAYDNGTTIYANSCAFCHGEDGTGNVPETWHLPTPPAPLTGVRANRAYIHRVLIVGIPGSAMPYFTMFDRYKLDDTLDYLGERFDLFTRPGPLPAALSGDQLRQSARYFDATCSQCHGIDGRGSTYGKQLAPAPPDFTQYNLTPQRTFEVITQGYPGTAMKSFAGLPEDVRWGLVRRMNSFRKP